MTSNGRPRASRARFNRSTASFDTELAVLDREPQGRHGWQVRVEQPAFVVHAQVDDIVPERASEFTSPIQLPL